MAYTVTAPLVVARDTSGRHHHLYTGAVLPEDIDEEQLKQLLDAEMVVKVKATASKKDADNAGDNKPTSVKDILKDVGDDKAKAQEYLDAENAAASPRSSLVEGLQAVLDAEA